jgi:hypothetical protein
VLLLLLLLLWLHERQKAVFQGLQLLLVLIL